MVLAAPAGKTPNLVAQKRLDIANDGTGSTPGGYTWVEVQGLKTLQVPNAYTTQDTSYLGGGGRGSDLTTQYKVTITGTLDEFVSADPTHVLLKQYGENPGSRLPVRLYNRNGSGGGKWGFCAVQWEPQGGDPTAIATNNFTLLPQDVWDDITNPSGVAPTVTSALPTAVTATGWVEILGTGFSNGVTNVVFGATAATTWVVVSDGRLYAKMPAGSAGAANIVVTTPAGANAAFTYTRGA